MKWDLACRCDAASRGDRDKLFYLVHGLGLDVDLGDYYCYYYYCCYYYYYYHCHWGGSNVQPLNLTQALHLAAAAAAGMDMACAPDNPGLLLGLLGHVSACVQARGKF